MKRRAWRSLSPPAFVFEKFLPVSGMWRGWLEGEARRTSAMAPPQTTQRARSAAGRRRHHSRRRSSTTSGLDEWARVNLKSSTSNTHARDLQPFCTFLVCVSSGPGSLSSSCAATACDTAGHGVAPTCIADYTQQRTAAGVHWMGVWWGLASCGKARHPSTGVILLPRVTLAMCRYKMRKVWPNGSVSRLPNVCRSLLPRRASPIAAGLGVLVIARTLRPQWCPRTAKQQKTKRGCLGEGLRPPPD